MRKVLCAAVVAAIANGVLSLSAAPIAVSTDAVADNSKIRSSHTVDEAESLLRQLTLDEKISLIGGQPDEFSTAPVKRLGITSMIMADGPQGVRNYGKACSFPCGAALASTWDVDLAHDYGKAIGLEARARNVNIMLGPGVNIYRVPVNGRNFEYYGEDPFLGGEIAANEISGMMSQGVVSTIKHFAFNNQEWHRDDIDVRVDDRAAHEIYLPIFERAVKQGGVLSFMAAYNRINGPHCSQSQWLLNTVLKGQWAFPGLVMSDWGATHSTEALAHGLDLEMGSADFFKPDRIKKALADGTIRQADIDNAVRRILRVAIAMDFFKRAQKRDLPLDSRASDETALNVARSAIVLLKNERNLLPLDRRAIRRIAVYGPNAQDTPADAGGSGAVTPFHSVSFLQGIRDAAASAQIDYTPMQPVNEDVYESIPNIFTAGGKPGVTMEVWSRQSNRLITSKVQDKIDIHWNKGEVPLGAPAGEKSVMTFKGELRVPGDGEWEVLYEGWGELTIGGRKIITPQESIVQLKRDAPTPLQVTLNVDPHSWHGGDYRMSLRPLQMPSFDAAKRADVVIACVGFNPKTEHEGADRSFDLTDLQQRLLAGVTAANPRTIVVINSGGAVGMTDWIDHAAGVLQAWYLGQEGGRALGEVLFGDVNPSGRLPDTFDRKFQDNPAYPNYPGTFPPGAAYPTETYAEGIFTGYRGYDKSGKDPLFPFGFGLSYTTFDFKNLKLKRTGDGVRVSVDVTNTGRRKGAEVVQIYVAQPNAPVPRPLRELKGFGKVLLDAGQTRRVDVDLPGRAFAYWDSDKQDWHRDPGQFNIEIGASEREIKLRGRIEMH